MGKKISLSKERAFRNNDSRLWSAVEMLEDLLEQIKLGNIKPKQIAVHWFEQSEKTDEIGVHNFYLSQCSIPEHFLLMTIGQAKMVDKLRGE